MSKKILAPSLFSNYNPPQQNNEILRNEGKEYESCGSILSHFRSKVLLKCLCQFSLLKNKLQRMQINTSKHVT